MDKEVLLQACNLRVRYGGIEVLNKVSLKIDEGEIVALMGPNGSGKSTIVRSIFGLVTIYGGEVSWQGKVFTPLPHQMARRGITFVPQGRRVLSGLSVEENLEIGGTVIQDKVEVKRRIEEMMRMFPVLREKRSVPSGTLSGGQQQMLALARGLMTNPKVLLLDEPSLGLAPNIVKEIFVKMQEINKSHKTAILIVEHTINALRDVAHRAYVLDKGKVVAEDTVDKLQESEVLEKVFLSKS